MAILRSNAINTALCRYLYSRSVLLCQVEIYIGYNGIMARDPRLTHITALILKAIDSGFVYGFSIMEMTGLPSGTIYPAMRRMEEDQLIRSRWERQEIADREQRPPRKYYQLTSNGRTALETSLKRYPLLQRLVPTGETRS